jgi:glutamate 5-kinase
VLLTHSDLANRTRANNARAALSALLDASIVPIINENDSVAVEEINFGDNDQLSSMIAPLVSADLLLLLSDVEGLQDGRGHRVSSIVNVAKDAMPLVRLADKSDLSKGGMTSKLEAARRATLAGAHVVIADARAFGIVGQVLAGNDVGTHFVKSEHRMSAKRHWIAFTLRPQGDIFLDAGCADAVRERGTSILAVGVLGVRGDFREGDAVRIRDASGAELGRALARVSVLECARLAGEGSGDIVVHRDELVVF